MSGILRDVNDGQWHKRLQREQQVRHSLRVAADRLESAEQERVANIAAAHQAGLSVRQIAAAVRLSPARVHQLLHAPVSASAVRDHHVEGHRDASDAGLRSASQPSQPYCASAPNGWTGSIVRNS